MPSPTRGRRSARTQAVFLLYQHDVTGLDMDELHENLRRDGGGEPDPFTQALVDGVIVDQPHLDGLIAGAAEGWTIDRIAPLERNVLRVAVHELLDYPETPVAVIVSEAVQAAKTYCAAEAPSFVNGILGTIARRERPGEAV